jgi:peptidoglycan/xylan/chitin deacetylase (PgdA/CDA1 family)
MLNIDLNRSQSFRLVAAFFCVILAGCAGRAGLAENFDGAESFGSRKILETLWTPDQLRGGDHDIARMTLDAPDLRPPERTEPLHELPPVPESLQKVIVGGEPEGGEKVAALTFDLCERAPHLAGYRFDLVNFLRENNIPATFFAGGKWMRSHPDKAMQLMADPLFELGNHAWTHGNLALMNEGEIRQQLLWTQAEYEILRERLEERAKLSGVSGEMRLVPESLRLMRLPYGRNEAKTLPVIASLGLPVIGWTVEGESSGPHGGSGPEAIVRYDLQRARPGVIYLMHANAVPKTTQIVVRELVPLLQAQGYRFVTVSELLRMGKPVTVEKGYFTTPGDNLFLDTLFGGKGTLGRTDKKKY